MADAQIMRRVLIVEDDYQLAEVIAEVLTFENCEPDIAANGMEALDRLRGEDFDAVICDVMMPRVGGEDFYRELSRQFPHLAERVLFITGAPAVRGGLTDFISRAGLPMLEKPFRVEDLRAAVQELLSR
jgi:DNA-binding response OmpR family regulator